MNELVPVPEQGRRFTATRRVRWGDADWRGRLRLDGLARYLQDVSNDDTRDAEGHPTAVWIVRRTTFLIEQPIMAGEVISLTTFCGGIGSRWAERRVSIVGDQGGQAEAASLWVYLDPTSGRPARLPADFLDIYGRAAHGRQVAARLTLPPAPPDGTGDRRPWPLRSTDLDGQGHVNNAATWEAVEDELACRTLVADAAELEYRDAIEVGDEVELIALTPTPDRLQVWLTVEGKVRATADVSVRPGRELPAAGAGSAASR